MAPQQRPCFLPRAARPGIPLVLKSTYTEARSPKPLHTRGSPRRHDSTQAGLCAHASATPGTAVERGCAAEGHSATTSQGHSSNRWLSWKNPSGKSHSQLCAGGTTGELRDSDGQERKRATRLHGQRAASPAGGAPSEHSVPPHTPPPHLATPGDISGCHTGRWVLRTGPPRAPG